MLSRRTIKGIGAVLVLIGFIFAIGLAGSCDNGSVSFLKAVMGVLICLVSMTAGAILIGGASDENSL